MRVGAGEDDPADTTDVTGEGTAAPGPADADGGRGGGGGGRHSDRRAFLQRTAGTTCAAVTGFGALGALAPARAAAAPAPGPADPVPHHPFHGTHQAGVLTPQQRCAAFVAYDVLAAGRTDLAELFRIVTDRARTLVRGVRPEDEEVAAQPRTPDELTITLGVGASLFDDRFGLAARRPRRLTAMPAFPDDALDPKRCHGDLSLQVCARHPDAVVHVLRDLARETGGLLAPRWRVDGFHNPPRPSGASRTFIGFKDGIVNPDTGSHEEMERLVWTGPSGGEPEWTAGGCYQVLRDIEFRVESWDRVPTPAQEKMIGRHKASGAPLGGRLESDVPDYSRDPLGRTIPLDAHIRLANPRTPETRDSQLLRRSYSYDGGFHPDGRMRLGLLFCCYQRDPVRQFTAMQHRLADEPLARFVTPVGGGYFFVLPGVRDETDWLGSGLLTR
ncbi:MULTISPECIES: Dyp-type peroxidase [Streptomyces]|uniref:Dyp-type peroxidase n=1 Tax=Streptomyces TaxID=1883 RepID=UPI0022497E6E|nr:Dyp-type peroxidase [Streptomyces sp. JHD 1]MCX2967285.1 Dyp-type peroxidase [Streptomyces sp. JHD 1]